MMDYSRSLLFAFDDPNWAKKLLIGGTLAFLAVFTGVLFFLELFVAGYLLGVVRNTLRNETTALPEWEDLGKIFVDGVLATIIGLAYMVVLGGAGALYFVYVAAASGLPGGSMALAIVVGAVLLYLVLSFSIAGALIRYAATNNIGEAFNIRMILRDILADLPAMLSIVLFVSVLQLILFLAGLGIFSPFLNFWGYVVAAHLFGQYGRAISLHEGQDIKHGGLTTQVS